MIFKKNQKEENNLIEVIPNIEVQDIKPEGSRIPNGMRKVFASYNAVFENGQMGFGNTMAMFNPEAYNESNIEKWLYDLQKSISMALESKLGRKAEVQVLFWR